MHSREVALKEQLHLYTSKYDDFQNSLQKSNTIFSTYKIELEKVNFYYFFSFFFEFILIRLILLFVRF